MNKINLLTENTSDEEGKVRFAVIENSDVSSVVNKIKEMIPDSEVNLIREKVVNPVLSKLKVNDESRYTI